MSHATIDAQYNCLSCQWGSPDLSHTLIVNGKRLSIAQNLHALLTAVRTFKYRGSGQILNSHLRDNLWIDAVCIDQCSDEKNHQVAQMGKIYGNARKVIMWLGDAHGKGSRRLFDTGVRTYLDFIKESKYWTRAWVVQEVMLARDPVLMLAGQLVPFPKFMENYSVAWRNKKTKWTSYRRSLLRQSNNIGIHELRGVLETWAWNINIRRPRKHVKSFSITDWLRNLQKVECILAHDRIFSLLELSAEGSRIPVDYTMPLDELVYRVFEAREHGVRLCEISLVIQLLGIEDQEAIDQSIPCVYAQWEEISDPPCCLVYPIKTLSNMLDSLGKRDETQRTFLQIPIQKLRDLHENCPVLTRRPRDYPVKLGRGLVHDLKRVTADELDLPALKHEASTSAESSTGPDAEQGDENSSVRHHARTIATHHESNPFPPTALNQHP